MTELAISLPAGMAMAAILVGAALLGWAGAKRLRLPGALGLVAGAFLGLVLAALLLGERSFNGFAYQDLAVALVGLLELPIDHPAAMITVLLGTVLLAPVVAKWLRLPGIIGLILAGIALGPHSFNVLARDARIELFARMGLLYIMFVAGAEVDLHQFGRSRGKTSAFGALTFLLPLVMGTLAGVYYLGFSWPTSVLLASMFSSHTLVAYPVINGLALSRKEIVIVGLGGTIITDTAAMIVLAVIAAMAAGHMGAGFWAQLIAALMVIGPGVLVFVPRLGRWSLRRIGGEGGAQFLFIMLVFYGCGFLAHAIGLEAILGAFFAGLALNRLIPEHSTVMNRLQFFGNNFFVPLFLISVGMLVDWRMVLDVSAWQVAITMIVIALLSKLVAAKVTQWWYGFTSDEGWVLYSLSVAQAAATMAAVLVGYRLGIFEESVLNGTVLMILVTCLVAPWVADHFGRKLAIEDARQAPPVVSGPDRILVPVTCDETAATLLEFAFLFRKGEAAEGPVHLLNVVTDVGEEQNEVTRAERLLSSCIAHGAAAETPVHPVIRLDMNIADGVSRAARELHATTIVLGWQGDAKASDQIFGSTFDHILEKCPQRLLACRFWQPPATAKRVVLALPPSARYDWQFEANLRAVKFIAHQLGGPLHVFLPPAADLRERIEATEPQVPTVFHEINVWRQGRALVDAANLGPDDLFVLFSARSGELQWRPWLNRLPSRMIQRYPDTPMIVFYPARTAEAPPEPTELDEEAALLAASIPESGGVAVPLDDRPFEDAVLAMLEGAFPTDPLTVERVHRSLQEVAREYAPEIAPGVALLHTHNTHLPQAQVLVGISPKGLDLPGATQPVGLLFVILGSKDQPADAHVHLLAAIAQIARNPEWVKALRAASSREETVRLLLSGGAPE